MTRVLVIHCTESGRLPEFTPEQVADLGKRAQELLKDKPDIKFNGTHVSEEGIGICDWETPDAKSVEEIVKQLGGPYDSVVEVKQVLP